MNKITGFFNKYWMKPLRYYINLILEADEPPEFDTLGGEIKRKTRDAKIDRRRLVRRRDDRLSKTAQDPNTGMQAYGKPTSNQQEFLLKSYLPTNPAEDAKYQYINMIVSRGLNNKNRYAPTIHKILSVRDPSTGLEKFQYRMQLYKPFTAVPVNGILQCFEDILYACDIDSKESEHLLSVGRNIVDSEYNNDNSVLDYIKSIPNYNNENEIKFYEDHTFYKEAVLQYMCHIFELIIDNSMVVVHDSELAEILDLIKEIDNLGIGNVDFNEYNVMFKYSGGWQIIFTDPLYGNY